MEEVLTRRLTNYLVERERPASERGRFAYPPQLLLVDGGKGQLSVAERVVADLGLTDEIPLASLAKRFEEVYVPGPVRAGAHPSPERGALPAAAGPRRGPPLRHHVPPRAAGQAHDPSVLDDIPGLGPVRQKRLVKELGGVGAVKQASLEDLLELAWLPDTVARAVYDKIHTPAR